MVVRSRRVCQLSSLENFTRTGPLVLVYKVLYRSKRADAECELVDNAHYTIMPLYAESVGKFAMMPNPQRKKEEAMRNGLM